MCEMYGHGFYWQKQEEWLVYMNFEENSHELQRNRHKDLIPGHAFKCGFDPVNGKAVSNDAVPLPKEVAERIEMIFVANFPDRASICRWIRHNYGANNDKREWIYRLGLMLSQEGLSELYTKEDCNQQAEDCNQQAEYWNQQAEGYKQQAEYWNQWAEDYNQLAEYCNQQAEDCNQQAEYWNQQAENCKGTISCDSPEWLEHFFNLFEKYPNDYWSERNIPKERGYNKSVFISLQSNVTQNAVR